MSMTEYIRQVWRNLAFSNYHGRLLNLWLLLLLLHGKWTHHSVKKLLVAWWTIQEGACSYRVPLNFLHRINGWILLGLDGYIGLAERLKNVRMVSPVSRCMIKGSRVLLIDSYVFTGSRSIFDVFSADLLICTHMYIVESRICNLRLLRVVVICRR